MNIESQTKDLFYYLCILISELEKFNNEMIEEKNDVVYHPRMRSLISLCERWRIKAINEYFCADSN